MKKKYLVACLLILIVACNERPSSNTTTILAGEIVNPTDSYVLLLKGEEVIDTSYLNSENRFVFRLDSIQDGLYNFSHKPEFQYVYLQRGDSMQMRLNTVAFDESLVFSGAGEAINNFLIDLYLRGEKEETLVRREYVQMEPEDFGSMMDSLTVSKTEDLELLKEEGSITNEAYDMGKASIEYQSYYFKEGYPFWHRKLTADKTLHQLPDNFYAYREKVSYENPELIFLKPYYDFMVYHIGNLAFMGCQRKCDTEIAEMEKQLHFNQHQLHLIDSLVTGQHLKDNLYRSVAFNYLLKNDSEANFDRFMQDFHELSGNNRHLEEIERLNLGIRKLRPEHPLPDLQVLNMNGDTVGLNQISDTDETLVLYFWAGPQLKHLENIRKKVNQLQANHGNYRFVGICMRTDQNRWKELVQAYGLDPEQQFWAEDFETFAHTLVVYHPYKTIIAREGKIVDGFANLNTSFE